MTPFYWLWVAVALAAVMQWARQKEKDWAYLVWTFSFLGAILSFARAVVLALL